MDEAVFRYGRKPYGQHIQPILVDKVHLLAVKRDGHETHRPVLEERKAGVFSMEKRDAVPNAGVDEPCPPVGEVDSVHLILSREP